MLALLGFQPPKMNWGAANECPILGGCCHSWTCGCMYCWLLRMLGERVETPAVNFLSLKLRAEHIPSSYSWISKDTLLGEIEIQMMRKGTSCIVFGVSMKHIRLCSLDWSTNIRFGISHYVQLPCQLHRYCNNLWSPYHLRQVILGNDAPSFMAGCLACTGACNHTQTMDECCWLHESLATWSSAISYYLLIYRVNESWWLDDSMTRLDPEMIIGHSAGSRWVHPLRSWLWKPGETRLAAGETQGHD